MRVAHRASPAAWALVAATAIYSAALARAPFLPFVDLPQHVAMAQLFLHRHDPAVAALYDVALVPQVNVLALFVMAPLHAVLPEGLAARALLVLYLAGMAFALHRLARALGTSPWNAVLAMLFVLHFDLWYGFLSFCLGMPALFALLARWAADADAAPTRARGLAADAALWMALALGHVLLFAFGIAAFGLWAACVRPRTAGLRAAAALPAVAWVAAWFVRAQATQRAFASDGSAVAWHGAATRLAELGRALGVARVDGRVEWAILACSAGLGIGLALAARRAAKSRGARERALRAWIAALAGCAILLYAVLPASVHDRAHPTHGVYLVYTRFLAFAPLLLALLVRWPAGGRARAIAIAATGALLVAHAVSLATLLGSVGREARGLDGALAALPPGSRVKSLVEPPRPHDLRFEAFVHVAALHQARTLGEVDQSFALIPQNPIHYRDPRRPYLSRRDEHLAPLRFDPARARLYDALLVRDPGGRLHVPSGCRPLFVENGWFAYEVEKRP